ncbi:hypothetical protein L228DRAFT_14593 [Xylona heveae TC161]|uniref:Uncharacterized protein n=1 Tax=Xylona heveae (strain CBS 132557 / TC161) TaxID=1328760 RepID=A0A165JR51_XYLHT|nr:hypothetical protein L228DRAFT_14593 [Xylona heveae TC161]KZF26532.1 hypothetical protein L228DRAFT_14593 [Xylona heveae TC161]
MSTMWVESWLPNGQTTWVEVIYSQTFASVPDQAPTPSSGQVGLGTHTGKIGVYKTDKERKNAAGSLMVSPGTVWSAAIGTGAMVAGAAFMLW